MMSPRELFLDYVNNFLTVEAFAEHYGMSEEEAQELITKEKTNEK